MKVQMEADALRRAKEAELQLAHQREMETIRLREQKSFPAWMIAAMIAGVLALGAGIFFGIIKPQMDQAEAEAAAIEEQKRLAEEQAALLAEEKRLEEAALERNRLEAERKKAAVAEHEAAARAEAERKAAAKAAQRRREWKRSRKSGGKKADDPLGNIKF